MQTGGRKRLIRKIRRNIERKKNTANYQRTSTGTQDLELQERSNLEYIEDHNIDEVKPFIDFDVSATKLSIDERPALKRLLRLVQEESINRVIAYNRDRIARNVYEYIYITKMFYEYDVEVIFTAEKAPPFSKDLFIETWYGLNAQFEGQNIGSRTGEARKKNPPSMIGYNKIVEEVTDELTNTKTKKRYYKAVKGVKEQINKLFEDISEAKNLKDIFETILENEKLLRRDADRILGILKTPFFAAHQLSRNDNYKPLSHVEPIVSLETFMNVQEVLVKFGKGIDDGNKAKSKEALITPICGSCKQQLKFKKGEIGQKGSYWCPKHRSNTLEINELESQVTIAIQNFIQRIDTKKLKVTSKKVIDLEIAKLNKTAKVNSFELESVCIEAATKYRPNEYNEELKRKMEKIKSIRQMLVDIGDYIRKLEVLRDEYELVVLFGDAGFNQLNENERLTLAELIIHKIEVHNKFVNVHLYHSEFLKEMEEEVWERVK